MIHFFIGTKAQLIKTAPVMVELQRRNIVFRYVDSGQHGNFTQSLRKIFRIKEPDFSFCKDNRDITNSIDAFKWVGYLLVCYFFKRKNLRDKVFAGGGICLIHGDTLSTLFGLMLAKAAKLKVGHIEAGLRSFNYLHPFPEEIIRIYCMKKCDFLFAPSDMSYNNLKSMRLKGKIIKVDGNTVVDALRFIHKNYVNIEIPKEPYALATCHRLETITNRNRLEKVIQLINCVSKKIKVVFVVHKPTRKYLKQFALMEKISSNVEIIEMQNYVEFTALIRNSKMVLADGGSIQEECAYLCKPCLILRNKTERPDGLGNNAMLWNFDYAVLDSFINNIDSITYLIDEWPKPSVKIADFLVHQMNS
ncbi:UDP-N-acetylglucosamine 2-epimerase [Desulfobotulus mexicanus]|uniref:UDP-N-acetyl glucosamine 2-epimerase n=1 Tax=Desulfobotulus mexicanus TaxID=2586642 RepID=A0A5Q4VI03_9BACT|nr:UDP-N-acetylglucosamine 2-epimerase [Desulfobotulus mexicanus]TYT75810.1 UDP-N-acetyl glucosamine 2-epimerase [Desulfobotulus mexicanus]